MTIYVADQLNNRIVKWNANATEGEVVSDKGYDDDSNSFEIRRSNGPWDVILDEQDDSLLICNMETHKVIRQSLREDTTNSETVLYNIDCSSLFLDDRGFLYVVNGKQHEVRRYKIGSTEWTVVAGGNGEGDRLDQLSLPSYIFVDRDYSVYVSDHENNRVMKWEEGAKQGIVVAGGNRLGADLTQLHGPRGVLVDKVGTVYVVDQWNHRVMRWPKGSKRGSVIAGGNGHGDDNNQFSYPVGLAFDQQGNLYVADKDNHRVQKFSLVGTV